LEELNQQIFYSEYIEPDNSQPTL